MSLWYLVLKTTFGVPARLIFDNKFLTITEFSIITSRFEIIESYRVQGYIISIIAIVCVIYAIIDLFRTYKVWKNTKFTLN